MPTALSRSVVPAVTPSLSKAKPMIRAKAIEKTKTASDCCPTSDTARTTAPQARAPAPCPAASSRCPLRPATSQAR